MAFKAIENEQREYPEIWNAKGALQQGDSIEGKLVDRREAANKFGGTTTYYEIEKADGTRASIVGSADLRYKLASVKLGALIRLTFTGYKETDKGSPMKVYTVEVDDGE